MTKHPSAHSEAQLSFNLEPKANKAGLAVIHGNKTEDLKQLMLNWIGNNPLSPLQRELVLVQSNGVGEWLKMSLANDRKAGGHGIAAGLELSLPSSFAWRVYRAVLGRSHVPQDLPWDMEPLRWRVYRLLGNVPLVGELAILEQYIGQDDQENRRWQLACQIADVLDQYQIYRADCMALWISGQNVWVNAHGKPVPLPEEQHWQPVLWRMLHTDSCAALAPSRASVHHQFLQAIDEPLSEPLCLPERVMVFGVSSMPSQLLEVLAGASRHIPVIVFLHNPCQYFWADIVAGADVFKATSRRLRAKPAGSNGNPLLAAWGKQGRDFMRLLDAYDATDELGALFNLSRVEVFENFVSEEPGAQVNLLKALQQDILDLQALPDQPVQLPSLRIHGQAIGIGFTSAFSALREVEVVQNQLIQALLEDPTLKPADCIVMVPDIDRYRPLVDAVFGMIPSQDARFIPWRISDQTVKAVSPLVRVLEQMLKIDTHRATWLWLVECLELPALQNKYGLKSSDVPTLVSWVERSGIRWGLNPAHRSQFGMPEQVEQNTWLFGLRRMLMGYAVGDAYLVEGLAPLDDVQGLNAQAVGALAMLLQDMEWLFELTQKIKPATEWLSDFQQILNRFFQVKSPEDTLVIDKLNRALDQAGAAWRLAQFEEIIPLQRAADCWLGRLDQGGLDVRFAGGAVTFSTLKPMRSIPFRRIYLLGLNDGDFPRQQRPVDFDLIQLDLPPRPGDRSRREDDRYLFLEALLSARDHLQISWVGRSMRDQQELQPSVLVAQLRDYLCARFSVKGSDELHGQSSGQLLDQLTYHTPLQPFSERYKRGKSGDVSFIHEWWMLSVLANAREDSNAKQTSAAVHADSSQAVLNAYAVEALQGPLITAMLKNPAKFHFQQVLGLNLPSVRELHQPEEPFVLNGLQAWALRDKLLGQLLLTDSFEQADEVIQRALLKMQASGELPYGALGAQSFQELSREVRASHESLHAWMAERGITTFRLEQSRVVQWQLAAKVGQGRQDTGAQLISVQLPNLRLAEIADGELWQIVHTAKSIQKKDSGRSEKPRLHALFEPWILHVMGQMAYPQLRTLIVGPDCLKTLEPMESERLCEVVRGWFQALQCARQSVLPVTLKTACAWLMNKQNLEYATGEFEGQGQREGERDQCVYLQTVWTDFDAMEKAGFENWAKLLYEPFARSQEIE